MRARRLIRETLTELDITGLDPCCEIVLVKDGFCVGRRFSFESAEAVWWEAEARIEIYDGKGRLLTTIDADGQTPMRKAA
jgi:hypothetical protein